jgi:hypothetical protein
MDPESGLDAVRDVGIRGKVIVAVAEKLQVQSCDLEVDCAGLVVAPGFIDSHAHGQNIESASHQVCDGVTTHLELEFGAFPVTPFYESRRGKALINFGCSVGHIPCRIATLSPGEQAAAVADCCMTPHLTAKCICTASDTHDKLCNCGGEWETLAANLRQGLAEGGLGIGTGIAYIPAANHEEIYRVFKVRPLPRHAHAPYAQHRVLIAIARAASGLLPFACAATAPFPPAPPQLPHRSHPSPAA